MRARLRPPLRRAGWPSPAAIDVSANPGIKAWLAWILVCVIWGTTYLAIKIALETVPPFLMGGLRYVAAGLILGGVLVAQGRRLPPISSWAGIALMGFFMLTLGNGGVAWGEQYVSSGLTAVLIGTSPFWMVSVDAMVSGHGARSARRWVGLVVGFAGIVALVWPDITAGGVGGRNFGWGVVAVQIACAGWAVGSAYTRRHVLAGDVLGAAALQMAAGGAFLIVLGTAMGEWGQFSLNIRTGAMMLYLTVAGSVVAFAAYSYALRHMDVAIVSLYTYVNPVIAVALGALILDEPFTLRMALAAAVIAAGIVIVGPLSKAGE
jgi:drug/metabolite transporter (DMT)-like permease